MKGMLIILMVIGAVAIGRFIYSRLSAKATLDRLTEKAKDDIRTVDDIYRALGSCIILNGDQYETFEEVEEDLHNRAKAMERLESSGVGSSAYQTLSDTNKKIYLIVNGYDLDLVPQYLLVKAMNSIGKPNDA